jgi:hypothetical protein
MKTKLETTKTLEDYIAEEGEPKWRKVKDKFTLRAIERYKKTEAYQEYLRKKRTREAETNKETKTDGT